MLTKVSEFSKYKVGKQFLFINNLFQEKDDLMVLSAIEGNSYHFTTKDNASVCLKDTTDISKWNIRPINKNHPKFDEELCEYGTGLGNVMHIIESLEGKELDESKILSTITSFAGKDMKDVKLNELMKAFGACIKK